MKTILYIFTVIALVFSLSACNKGSREEATQKTPKKSDLMHFADSLKENAESQSNNLEELLIFSEDNGTDYTFDYAYLADKKLLTFGEQTGNDSVFYEAYYFLDANRGLRLFESFGKSMKSGDEIHHQKTYFYKDSAIENIYKGTPSLKINPKMIISNYNNHLEKFKEINPIARKD